MLFFSLGTTQFLEDTTRTTDEPDHDAWTFTELSEKHLVTPRDPSVGSFIFSTSHIIIDNTTRDGLPHATGRFTECGRTSARRFHGRPWPSCETSKRDTVRSVDRSIYNVEQYAENVVVHSVEIEQGRRRSESTGENRFTGPVLSRQSFCLQHRYGAAPRTLPSPVHRASRSYRPTATLRSE